MRINTVSIVKGADANYIVEETFNLLKPKVRSADLCLVKPNLCTLKSPETGATTHPELVEGIVNMLRDRFAEVVIVESDSAANSAEMKFRYCGYYDVAKRADVKLLNLTRTKCVNLKFENAGLTMGLPRTLLDCDYFVSVPTLKTHSLTVFTANIKNLYGLLPHPRKTMYHGKVHEIVAELHALVQPKLCLVDGIVGMEGNGPNRGDPAHFGAVIGGTDTLYVDTVSCNAIGLDPLKVRYLRLSADYLDRKLPNLNDVNIVGSQLEDVKRRFKPAPSEQPFRDWSKDSLMAAKPIGFILDRTLIPAVRRIRKKKIRKVHAHGDG